MTVCVTCGLPNELCVCESIAKETQKITVSTVRKKFRKFYTIIDGIDQKEIDLEQLTKTLKAKLACGGTIKDGHIELQGNHKQKVRKLLVETGFAPETIIMK